MTKHCSSCGAGIQQEARFCRQCGAPSRNLAGGTGDVSPDSATVPLKDVGRTTDGLAAEDPRRASADTTRVNRDELERLLQTQQSQRTLDAAGAAAVPPEHQAPTGPRADAAVPTTGELALPGNASEDLLKTRASFAFTDDDAEDLTVVAPPRASRPFDEGDGARRVEPTPPHAGGPQPPTGEAVAHPAPPPHPPTARAPRGKWPYVIAACALLLLAAAGVALVAVMYLRRQAPTEVVTQAPTPPPDAAQLFEEKLAQAESSMAAGQFDAAVSALREANQLDPANWKAHRRLGELLWESGQRREAIEEYRAAATNNPNDFTLWRALASAEAAEGLPQEAAESYKRLVDLVGEAAADPNDLLAYADALRLAGRAEEARGVYQKLVSVAAADVASAARQRLAELAQPTPSPTPGQQGNTNTRPDATPTPANPQATPTPPPAATPTPPPPTPAPTRPAELSPADSYQRGVQLWSSNRGEALRLFRAAANAGNPDAHYYLGLGYVEGRDPGSLKRAEIGAALQHFQNAQRGQHAARARQYALQLEREFDRIRNQR
jgi:tetratricopeptide (TPR) repeat protein